jgi:hypothetical protein
MARRGMVQRPRAAAPHPCRSRSRRTERPSRQYAARGPAPRPSRGATVATAYMLAARPPHRAATCAVVPPIRRAQPRGGAATAPVVWPPHRAAVPPTRRAPPRGAAVAATHMHAGRTAVAASRKARQRPPCRRRGPALPPLRLRSCPRSRARRYLNGLTRGPARRGTARRGAARHGEARHGTAPPRGGAAPVPVAWPPHCAAVSPKYAAQPRAALLRAPRAALPCGRRVHAGRAAAAPRGHISGRPTDTPRAPARRRRTRAGRAAAAPRGRPANTPRAPARRCQAFQKPSRAGHA